MKPGQPNRRANKVVARFIPLFLLAIIGYGSWVFTKLICIDYVLLSKRRTGSAIAILTIYYFLLLNLVICFSRVIETIVTNPGLVPRGHQWHVEKEAKKHKGNAEKEDSLDGKSSDKSGRRLPDTRALPWDKDYNIDEFWHKDIFTCKYDGRPAFCSSCFNYKPDRAHHCRELDRCVVKMDHFCPWAGGIISETSFKFFIQFTGAVGLFCFHALVVIAFYFAERNKATGFIDANWIVALVLAALFTLFAGGMWLSSIQLALVNSTTIENLSRKTQVWYLAVHIPEHVLQKIEPAAREKLRLITYPRPPEEQLQILENNGMTINKNTTPDVNGRPGEINSDNTTHSPQMRTFAILETEPGTNPFDIGYSGNLKEVMGYNIIEWFLPIKMSPLTRHDLPQSMYKMGPLVERLKREAGIPEESVRRRHSSHRRRRSRRDSQPSE